MKKRDRALLKENYFNPKKPGSFGGKNRLISAVKNKVKPKDVSKWLASTNTYTLHKPASKNFKRRKFITSGKGVTVQVDLTDLSKLAKYNNGNKFILFGIDIFSRYGWAAPIKNKSAMEVTNAMINILEKEDKKPLAFNSDEGTEFKSKLWKNMLEKYGITHYFTFNREIKSAAVERLQRTIKSRLFRYFTHSGTYRYVDVLQDIMDSYNHSVHSAIRMRPVDVTFENQEKVWQSLYNPDVPYKDKTFKFAIGDRVRISKYSSVFRKGYLPTWSEEIFSISDRHTMDPVVYKLKDDSGEVLEGSWYEKELQKVDTSEEVYTIEKIVGTRKVNGKIQYLVRWAGYPASFDSYVDKKDMLFEYKN